MSAFKKIGMRFQYKNQTLLLVEVDHYICVLCDMITGKAVAGLVYVGNPNRINKSDWNSLTEGLLRSQIKILQ